MIRPQKQEAVREKIRVAVAFDSQSLERHYASALSRQQDMELVAVTAANPVDLLLAVKQTQADVVLLSWNQGEEMPSVCTHLFAEYGELIVVGVAVDGTATQICQQQIMRTPIRMKSSNLLDVLRQKCDSDQMHESGASL